MANKKFLVSVADAYGYDSKDNLLFVGKTLLDTSIETTLANNDVRAGKGNQLQYVYYHTAEMNITINDAQFSLEYIALNVGSAIETGKEVWYEETVIVDGGAGTVTYAPLAVSTQIIYGWVTLADGTVQRVTFTGNNFTVPGYDGEVCVRYYRQNDSAKSVTIYADMMPSTIRLVLEATLASSDATTNKIGVVQVEVPKASMTGAFTLSMTPDGVAQTPLSVRALASGEVTGAGSRPTYATITEILDNAKWHDDIIALAIEAGDVELDVAQTKALKVYAIPKSGAAMLAPLSGLTFATSDDTFATVSNAGVVTAVATGTATIKATITDKPEIDANITVTVKA